MKKNNRSQSSIRVKTLQPEEDWGKKGKPSKVSSSMIGDDKENFSMFQSVSERYISPVYESSEVAQGAHETMLRYYQTKCADYEGQIRELIQPKQSRDFKYSERYFVKEVEELRRLLCEKESQVAKYQQMYSSKSCLAQDMSSEISQKLEKQQRDKNLYIKEINNKNIEINKLQELTRIYLQEKDTLNLLLQEKETQVQHLANKLAQLDFKKKKVDDYEIQIKETQLLLRDIEAQAQRLREEADTKDQLISDKANNIEALEQRSLCYQDRMREFEESLAAIHTDKKVHVNRAEEASKECEKWREAYEQLAKKEEQNNELIIQLKGIATGLDELKKRNSELLSANDKLRAEKMHFDKAIAKSQELERELASTRKDAKEKDERIIALEAKDKASRELEAICSKLRREKEEAMGKVQEKVKEHKLVLSQLEEARVRLASLGEELQQMEADSHRNQERHGKIDSVVRENTRLTAGLVDKVNEIERLQHKLNSLDNKLCNANNELAKTKVILEQKEQQFGQHEQALAQSQLEAHSLRGRFETEMNHRLDLEQRTLKVNQELLVMKNCLVKGEEDRKNLEVMLSSQEDQHQKSLEECTSVMKKMEEARQVGQGLLAEAHTRIEHLKTELHDLRRVIEDITRKELDYQATLLALERDLKHQTSANLQLKTENHALQATLCEMEEFGRKIISLRK